MRKWNPVRPMLATLALALILSLSHGPSDAAEIGSDLTPEPSAEAVTASPAALPEAGSDEEPMTAEEVLARMAEARKRVRSARYKIKRYPTWQAGEGEARSGQMKLQEQTWLFENWKCRQEQLGWKIDPDTKQKERYSGDDSVSVYDGEFLWIYLPARRTAMLFPAPDGSLAIQYKPFAYFHYGLEFALEARRTPAFSRPRAPRR